MLSTYPHPATVVSHNTTVYICRSKVDWSIVVASPSCDTTQKTVLFERRVADVMSNKHVDRQCVYLQHNWHDRDEWR